MLSNANNDQLNERLLEEERSKYDRTPSPIPGKQFRQANKKFTNQDSIDLDQNKSARLRSQSTAGFKASSASISTPSNSTPGLLSKRRAQSLAKQTLDSSSNYLDNIGRSSNSNLSAIQDEFYFDYPLRRTSRNASSKCSI